MRVGIDSYTLRGLNLGAFEILAFVHDHDLAGVQLGSALAISPALDPEALREFRAEANRLGLYVEVGVPTVNPHRFSTTSPVAALGAGDYAMGIERLVRAAHVLGCRELHSTIGQLGDRLASPQWVRHRDEQGQLRRERFVDAWLSPPVAWTTQLRDTTAFLRTLRPLLRDLGCRINLETHADATTFELVRMVEELGEDLQGLTLDTANVMNQLEDPVAAARRAAPYVHGTHAKDGIVFFDERGLAWAPRPLGQGSLDWEEILPILGHHDPDLTLSIEDHTWIYELPIYEAAFIADHRDLTPAELGKLVRLAWLGQQRIERGEAPRPDDYELIPWSEHQVARIDSAGSFMKGLLSRLGLGAERTEPSHA